MFTKGTRVTSVSVLKDFMTHKNKNRNVNMLYQFPKSQSWGLGGGGNENRPRWVTACAAGGVPGGEP